VGIVGGYPRGRPITQESAEKKNQNSDGDTRRESLLAPTKGKHIKRTILKQIIDSACEFEVFSRHFVARVVCR